jgi:PTS system N-acetylgalactosamine-specific IIA component
MSSGAGSGAGAPGEGDEPGERPRAPAVVAGHGAFAEGLISAAAQIGGQGGLFVPMSNTGKGAAEIADALRALVDETGATVIFTDLPAGSCTIAARRLVRERPALVLITGANLATLLDYAFHAHLEPSAAARHAAEKGRESLLLFGGEGTGAG